VDAPVDGILVERLAGPEECLQVGQVLARMETQLGWH
jgi:pyruvate/2-oxoglutarate dehydrogenase complex dihydrolipoamide acyltransferase (E2) component